MTDYLQHLQVVRRSTCMHADWILPCLSSERVGILVLIAFTLPEQSLKVVLSNGRPRTPSFSCPVYSVSSTVAMPNNTGPTSSKPACVSPALFISFLTISCCPYTPSPDPYMVNTACTIIAIPRTTPLASVV